MSEKEAMAGWIDWVKVFCPTRQKKVILEMFFPANLSA